MHTHRIIKGVCLQLVFLVNATAIPLLYTEDIKTVLLMQQSKRKLHGMSPASARRCKAEHDYAITLLVS